jgi:DNA-binding transcriptional MerR regulator
LKLKEVEAQLQEERHKREEMASQFEETQRQHEERMEKQLEEKLTHIFYRMNPFTVSRSTVFLQV